MKPAAIVAAMAALEEWQLRDDNRHRVIEVSFVGEHGEDPLKLWYVTLWVAGGPGDEDFNVVVTGKTMADALAQAAQVVTSDPLLESVREGG